MRAINIMRKFRTGCLAMLFVASSAPALASQVLTVTGAQLPPVIVSDLTAGAVEKTVLLGADIPEATHVVVQMAGGHPLMRDRQGLFQPWDIDQAQLADNGFTPVDGQLLYKVFNQDLSAQNFPIRVTLYYRANGELKFGYFDVMRAD